MSWSDVQVGLDGVNGLTVTVWAHNPTAAPQTARVRIGVSLFNGTQLALTSGNLTLQPDQTLTVPLVATGAIGSITDAPSPVEPD